MSQHVTIERRGAVAVVTIDRQEALNALSSAVLSDLESALGELEQDAAIRALVLTGAGAKSFVAGADIKEMSGFGEAEGKAYAERGQALFARIERFQKPVVAAVNGFALGGGCELAMACHVRYASQKARFGQPEVKLGLIPGFGGTQRLTRLVGRGRALEILLDGNKMLPADEALRIGLINAVFPPEELLDAAVALAERIAQMGPEACAWVIEAVAASEPHEELGLEKEAELFGRCFDTANGKEGMTAFLERRDPNWG